MPEIAEFVGGDMDGRTVETTDPAPQFIRVPVLVGRLPVAYVEEPPDFLDGPSFRVEDYEKVGRNDAGHLRYMRRENQRRIR